MDQFSLWPWVVCKCFADIRAGASWPRGWWPLFSNHSRKIKGMLVFCWKECFNVGMLKTEAIEILGGTVTSAARAVGVSPQAVSLWPDVLTDAIRDRVQAAMWRQSKQFPSANRSPSAIESAANQTA